MDESNLKKKKDFQIQSEFVLELHTDVLVSSIILNREHFNPVKILIIVTMNYSLGAYFIKKLIVLD